MLGFDSRLFSYENQTEIASDEKSLSPEENDEGDMLPGLLKYLHH